MNAFDPVHFAPRAGPRLLAPRRAASRALRPAPATGT
jgi:hypothetical protein